MGWTVKVVVMMAMAGACAMAPPAFGEVADSSASGFTVKITSQIQAAPADVYGRIIKVGEWWDSSHTYSQDAHNLSIEERAGGCFCEKVADGGGCSTWKLSC